MIDVVYVVLDHGTKHTELVGAMASTSSNLSRGFEVCDERDERTPGESSKGILRSLGEPNTWVPKHLKLLNGGREQVVDLR